MVVAFFYDPCFPICSKNILTGTFSLPRNLKSEIRMPKYENYQSKFGCISRERISLVDRYCFFSTILNAPNDPADTVCSRFKLKMP